MRLVVSREIDYRIAVEVLGYPPFNWKVGDRLALEFSHGEKHHSSPCLVCGRVRGMDDLLCLPRYSTSREALWGLIEKFPDLDPDMSPMEFCESLLRARGKEVLP